MPFLEGREAAGQFFPCGRTLTTQSLPSACFSPGQAQQPPEGLKGSGSGAERSSYSRDRTGPSVTGQRHSRTPHITNQRTAQNLPPAAVSVPQHTAPNPTKAQLCLLRLSWGQSRPFKSYQTRFSTPSGSSAERFLFCFCF